MLVDHEIHLGDAFSLGNGFDHVPFFHGSPRAGFETDMATVRDTSDKIHFTDALSLGNGVGPVFFYFLAV